MARTGFNIHSVIVKDDWRLRHLFFRTAAASAPFNRGTQGRSINLVRFFSLLIASTRQQLRTTIPRPP